MLRDTRNSFEGSSKLYFLTLRGLKNAHQKIDFTIKKCKKIAKTFIIVREKNKRTEGYHFHALIKATVEPGKSWYSKGVHMNMKRVGRRDTNVTYPPPHIGELHDRKALDEGLITPTQYADAIVDKIFEDHARKDKRKTHVDRLLHYMSKDLHMPIQYHDYYYSLRGASKRISRD